MLFFGAAPCGESNVFISPSASHNLLTSPYRNSQRCYWFVQTRKTHELRINFRQFSATGETVLIISKDYWKDFVKITHSLAFIRMRSYKATIKYMYDAEAAAGDGFLVLHISTIQRQGKII